MSEPNDRYGVVQGCAGTTAVIATLWVFVSFVIGSASAFIGSGAVAVMAWAIYGSATSKAHSAQDPGA